MHWIATGRCFAVYKCVGLQSTGISVATWPRADLLRSLFDRTPACRADYGGTQNSGSCAWLQLTDARDTSACRAPDQGTLAGARPHAIPAGRVT